MKLVQTGCLKVRQFRLTLVCRFQPLESNLIYVCKPIVENDGRQICDWPLEHIVRGLRCTRTLVVFAAFILAVFIFLRMILKDVGCSVLFWKRVFPIHGSQHSA